MINNRISIIRVSLFLFLCIFGGVKCVYASLGGTPGPSDCIGSVGWSGTHDCWWDAKGQSTGVNLIPNPTTLTSRQSNTLIVGFNNYVPYSGDWVFRTYVCQSPVAIACTVAKASSYVDSPNTLRLLSGTSLAASHGNWGEGKFGQLPANSSLCYTYVDPREPDIPWGTDAMRTCQDAQKLPTVPSDCYVGRGQVLDVDLGTLERSEIPTTADKNSIYAKSETVKVLCTRDAGLTAKVKFKYTPVNINGEDLVSTGNGIGIAIYYNGSLMGANKDTDAQNFEMGYSDVNLTFTPVRDANIPIKEITTGDFAADAVMELTEQ